MRVPRGATNRPFTVAVCTPCDAEPELGVLAALRTTVRRCPHAVLATTACLRGPLNCRAHPHDRGVITIVQPCTVDRTPHGPTLWIGPIRDQIDLHAVQLWLENGRWNLGALPARLTDLARPTPSHLN